MDKETVERVDLMPCPFCGSAPNVLATLDRSMVIISCGNCSASIGMHFPDQAMERWNTRVQSDTIPIVDIKQLGQPTDSPDRPALQSEIPPAMVEVGGQVLLDELWKLNPMGEAPLGPYTAKRLAETIYRAMAAERA